MLKDMQYSLQLPCKSKQGRMLFACCSCSRAAWMLCCQGPASDMQRPEQERLTTNAYCMSTVRLQPARIVMELIADSWASA